VSDGVRSGPAVGQHACYVPASGAGNGRVISRKQGERPVARQRVGRGSGVVFGGDSGGGFLAEADVGAEAGQVLVAALGLEFGCGFVVELSEFRGRRDRSEVPWSRGA
jgi:hypothetical protein